MTPAAIRILVADHIAATLEEVVNIAQRLMDQDLVLSSVRLTTRWVIRPEIAETKDPQTTRLDSSYSFC
ncbi:hypothetical protein Tco_1198057 [Tanacetum coccineum]